MPIRKPDTSCQVIMFLTAGLLYASLAACSAAPQFYINPTSAPAPSVSPEPSPTAHVVRTIPFGHTPAPIEGTSTRRPGSDASSTGYSSVIGLPSGATPIPYSKPILIGSPEWNLRQAFVGMEWQESVSIQSKFYWPVAVESEAGGESGNENADEVLVEVEGDFELVLLYNTGDPAIFAVFEDREPEFHLLFSQEQPGSPTPLKTEILARLGRLVTDTTVNNLKTYRTVAEWRNDFDREKLYPGIAMFISLALTGGRIVEDDFGPWITFEPGEVIQTVEAGEDGSEFDVYEANRVNENGDKEDWRVWIDGDNRPTRIELTIISENPGRSLRGAELEITYTGENLKPEGIP